MTRYDLDTDRHVPHGRAENVQVTIADAVMTSEVSHLEVSHLGQYPAYQLRLFSTPGSGFRR